MHIKILVVIPARGGSKGIKNKNLRKVASKSLVAHAIEYAQKLPWASEIHVSTDHRGIALEAAKFGAEPRFLRPEPLSGEFVGDVDVLKHAVLTMESCAGHSYDAVAMIQPTSPLRTMEDASEVYAAFEAGHDSVWTISPVDLHFHPKKLLKSSGSGSTVDLSFYDKDGPSIIARQQLDQVHCRNGALYLISRDLIVKKNRLYGDRWAGVVSNGERLSIDSMSDLAKIRRIWSNG